MYIVKTVLLWDKSDGNTATFAPNKTVEIEESIFPQESEMIIKSTYLDGIIDSFNDYDEAEKIASDLNSLIEWGGFKIKEWCIY